MIVYCPVCCESISCTEEILDITIAELKKKVQEEIKANQFTFYETGLCPTCKGKQVIGCYTIQGDS